MNVHILGFIVLEVSKLRQSSSTCNSSSIGDGCLEHQDVHGRHGDRQVHARIEEAYGGVVVEQVREHVSPGIVQSQVRDEDDRLHGASLEVTVVHHDGHRRLAVRQLRADPSRPHVDALDLKETGTKANRLFI